MSKKLPKQVIQMVEKNNIVMAIKMLAEEQNLSLAEAKMAIDEYDSKLKQTQLKKVAAIASKQGLPSPNLASSNANQDLNHDLQTNNNPNTQYSDSASNNELKPSAVSDSDPLSQKSSQDDLQKPNIASNGFDSLNQGLDTHLDRIGYKKPLLPYWAKRVLIIVIIMIGLGLIFAQL